MAVKRFVDTYNWEWLVEKNGFKSPWQARAQWLAQASLARQGLTPLSFRYGHPGRGEIFAHGAKRFQGHAFPHRIMAGPRPQEP